MDFQESTTGKELDPTFQSAKDAALRFLGYRARSEAEVRRRLLQRYPEDLVERVVQVLKDQRFLDDQAFARHWRDNREQHRPRAQRLIRQELWRLGVPPEVIQTTLSEFDNETNAYQAGAKLVHKLRSRNYSEEELKRRLWSHLRQRGFAYGEINGVVGRLLSELGADFLHRQYDSNDEEKQRD